MANIQPMKIRGRWRDGRVLDYHTLSSTYLGDNQFGRPQYDTKRTELGELLYRLKYRSDESAVAPLVEAVASFVSTWNPGAEMIVPVPASRARASQPALVLAEAIAGRLDVRYAPRCVKRTRDVPELKDVCEFDERTRLLSDLHAVDKAQVQGRKVLLFDDLYRSGATMEAITRALYDDGSAADVFALAITRTRRNQ